MRAINDHREEVWFLEKRSIALNDWMRFQAVGSPKASPDGRWVSFHLSTSNLAEDRNETSLWLYHVEDGTVRQLTHGPKDGEAEWAPDSRHLAFIASREGKDRVYSIQPDGGEAVALSQELKSPAQLSWAPDGLSLAVTVLCVEPETAIVDLARALSATENADDTFHEQQESHLRVTTRFPFRFDGLGYFDAQRRHLVQLAAFSRDAEPVQLTHGEFDVMSYSWRPDGKSLTYVTQKVDEDMHDAMIFELRLDTLESRTFLDPGGAVVSTSWSSNGQYLAWIGNDGSYGWGTENQLWVHDTVSGQMTNLTQSLDRQVGEVPHGDVRGFEGFATPCWSANGQYLFVQVHVNGVGMLYRVDVTGQEPTPLLEQWSGVAHSPSIAGGNVYFAGEDFYHPPELFRVSAVGGVAEVLTSFNEPLLQQLQLGEFTHYELTRGSFSVEGFVGSPEGSRGPLPAILYIHGGPHGAFGHVFRHEYFMEMARGRRVIFVNPRGSQGYGQEFAGACINDWGGEDFQDLMGFLDFTIQEGLVDSKRMGVTGISYGGYMTNWTITHTSRFSAAISEMSVSNHLSMYTHSDIGPDFMRSEFGAAPWDGWERLWERSPIRYVSAVTTPTLFIAGQEDYRCPQEQSEAMYVALRRHQIPTALVTFPNAAHGFSVTGKPSQRLERRRLMEAWWKRYLHE